MPKTLSAGLDAARSAGTTTLAWCVKATREQSDGAVYAFTTWPRPLLVNGVTYQTGFERTSIVTAGDLAVDNLEILGAMESSEITEDDIRAGKWDGARIEYFEVNALNLSQGMMHRRVGWLGEVRSGRLAFVAELHGLLRRLQQEIGRIFAPGCQWELGEATTCGVRLLPPLWSATTPYTIRQARDAKTGSVVRSVAENGRYFRCSTAGTSGASEPAWNTGIGNVTADGSAAWTAFHAMTFTLTVLAVITDRLVISTNAGFPDEWFSDGRLTWLTGLNAGTGRQFVKRSLSADGRVDLRRSMFFAIAPGDTASIEAGCFKRRDEDCRDKFDNTDNHGGFPDLAGLDQVSTAGITT